VVDLLASKPMRASELAQATGLSPQAASNEPALAGAALETVDREESHDCVDESAAPR
jgi:hypothetical protein